jgi:hypothetical protein
MALCQLFLKLNIPATKNAWMNLPEKFLIPISFAARKNLQQTV